jgi:aspartate/methionine/tyrosine aminotransferase
METLSSRATPFITGASNPTSYGSIHVSLLNDLYDKDSNPNGAILMSIAENKLCNGVMLEKIKAHATLPVSVLNYTDGTGVARWKSIMAECLTDVVFKLPASDSASVVNPQQLIISTGCTGLLFQLSVVLFEVGDSILIPTPYYPAFDQDFGYLGGVRRVPVDPSNLETYNLTVEDLERAYTMAISRNQPPRAVLLTNPHNPLGKVYTTHELRIAVEWCRERKIHLICDEIYALSVFDTSVHGPFVSVAALLENQLGDYVHVLWGVSKDLGGSGLRVGVLYSQNQALLTAVGGSNTAFQVSNVIHEILADTLADRTFLSEFQVLNSDLIKRSYVQLSEGLRRLDIPHYRAGAGMFLFADMRRLLKETTFEAERDLHLALVREIKWSLTPGGPCHHSLPGFFRLCYCWVSTEAIEECLRRFERFIETWLKQSTADKV